MYHASKKAIALSLSTFLILSAPPALSQESSHNSGRDLDSGNGASITPLKKEDKDNKEENKPASTKTSSKKDSISNEEENKEDSTLEEDKKPLIDLYDFHSDDYVNPPINPRASYFYLHKTPDYEMSGDGVAPPVNPKPPKNRDKEKK